MEEDNPPPYEASTRDDIQDAQVLEPAIFILTGQSIHIETVDSLPAYELSRRVTTLTKATENVTFGRFDQIISSSSTTGTAIPIVKRRRRHIYNLQRTAKQPRIGLARSRSKSDAPEYYIHSVSRRTLGHLGLRKLSGGGFSAGFRAVPMYIARNQARCADWQQALFELYRKDNKSEWKWQKDGITVAVEDCADSEHRLIFMKALPRMDVDALVAIWCCRIWQEAAVRAEAERSKAEGSE